MGKLTCWQSMITLKWMNLKTFIFLFSLKTGMQTYSLSTFMISVIIVDALMVKWIEQQLCEDYRIPLDRLSCYTTKLIILPQACLAFMSALQLWTLKKPEMPLCWVGCKLVVGVTQLFYLPEWTKDVVFSLLPGQCSEAILQVCTPHLVSVVFTVLIVVVDLYGVLIALCYYSELADNQAFYTFRSDIAETSPNIPTTPGLPTS